MKPITKQVLIGVGAGIFFSLSFFGKVPGLTELPVSNERYPVFIGIGIAIGFFVGLINLSRANLNPGRIIIFVCCLTFGLVVLATSLYHGFIIKDFGFNIASIVSAAFLPSLILGGLASKVYSKQP